MPVSLKEYSKALRALEEALEADKSDLVRDATIQRFEFCVELAWKTAKKLMGTQEVLPKQVIREMLRANIITDTQIWFDAIKNRNLSSHTYNEDLAEEVYQFAKIFLKEALNLEKELAKL